MLAQGSAHDTISRKFRVFHKFIKPHMGLNGRTPAEAAGIKIQGDNKWRTLIENASHVQRINRENGVQ